MASYDPRALLNPKSRAKETSKKRTPNYGTSLLSHTVLTRFFLLVLARN